MELFVSADCERTALIMDAPLGACNILYSKTGDLFGRLSMAGMLFFVLFMRSKRSQKAK